MLLFHPDVRFPALFRGPGDKVIIFMEGIPRDDNQIFYGDLGGYVIAQEILNSSWHGEREDVQQLNLRGRGGGQFTTVVLRDVKNTFLTVNNSEYRYVLHPHPSWFTFVGLSDYYRRILDRDWRGSRR